MAKTKKKFDIYESITQTIIDSLKEGKIPWKKTWSGGTAGLPMNFITKKPYRGVNMFTLSMTPFDSPYFLTYNQAKAKGGQVRKGEKSSMVVFWKMFKATDKATGLEKTIPMLRYFNVFNVEQVDGLKLPKPKKVEGEEKKKEFNPIEEAEAVVASYKTCPPISHGGSRAYYTPALDTVQMPKKESFTTPEAYYSTLSHELAHSTGHSSRLNRDFGTAFGSDDYSKEELVAEMTAAFFCATCGISNETIDNSKAYIQGWLAKLSDNPKWIIEASSKARKAMDLIADQEYKAVETKKKAA